MTGLKGVTVVRKPVGIAAVATKPKDPTPSHSGTWNIVPGVLWLDWKFDPKTNEGSIDTNFLWWTINNLTGAISKTNLELEDKLDFIGVVEGDMIIKASYSNPGEVRLKASLSVFGSQPPWGFDFPIVKW